MISQHTAGNNAFKPYNTNEDKAMATQSVKEENTGGNQPHDIMQPYQAVNFIICLQGIFPSRS
jgi:microcystin-dependent protein